MEKEMNESKSGLEEEGRQGQVGRREGERGGGWWSGRPKLLRSPESTKTEAKRKKEEPTSCWMQNFSLVVTGAPQPD